MRTDSLAPLRLAVLATLAGLTGLAGLAGCANRPGTAQGVPAQTIPAGGVTTTAPASSPSTPASTPPRAGATAPAAPVRTGSTHHQPAPVGSCRARDLVLDSIQGDGGGGSAFETVTVTNDSHTACRLPSTPSMVYTDTHGTTRRLPTSPQVPNPPAMLMRPGNEAQFTLRIVNGYGGYNPSSPACAHPATYQHIALTLPDGRLALTGLTLDVLCDGITVTGWSAPQAS
ncbi:DUF4232 domain-containing protein [Rugosimonospora africana]|uniref:DUF4232 domain-containing protein n=1 Tax=Rugosimonospora africana TaxID=556532 RepID=A0A8J3VVQ0_9ACTN|nr:DUF4232 domain-containing protein [Rugosimonospora africana]GIH20006.1 hypothetical protein Raf01_81780 [Rugosimonospora africana]